MTKTTPMMNIDTGKTADIHPDEIKNMEAVGWRIDDKAKAKTPDDDGSADHGENLTDDELREAIKEATGKAPHWKAKRETLIEQLNEAKSANG